MAFNPDFLERKSEDAQVNQLLKYLQHQSPEVLAQIAKATTPQVKDIITHNIQGLLGMLPSDGFSVQVNTDRDNLANLLGSAMMTGYFLRQMEQRMELEEMLIGSSSIIGETAPKENREQS